MDHHDLVTIVIVSRQNRRRESLRSLLKVLPQIGAVYGTQDQHAAQSLLDYYQPAIALFDGDPAAGEVNEFLQRVKISSPHTRCILLSSHPQPEQVLPVRGVDYILYDGFPTLKLLEVVQELLVAQA